MGGLVWGLRKWRGGEGEDGQVDCFCAVFGRVRPKAGRAFGCCGHWCYVGGKAELIEV